MANAFEMQPGSLRLDGNANDSQFGSRFDRSLAFLPTLQLRQDESIIVFFVSVSVVSMYIMVEECILYVRYRGD